MPGPTRSTALLEYWRSGTPVDEDVAEELGLDIVHLEGTFALFKPNLQNMTGMKNFEDAYAGRFSSPYVDDIPEVWYAEVVQHELLGVKCLRLTQAHTSWALLTVSKAGSALERQLDLFIDRKGRWIIYTWLGDHIYPGARDGMLYIEESVGALMRRLDRIFGDEYYVNGAGTGSIAQQVDDRLDLFVEDTLQERERQLENLKGLSQELKDRKGQIKKGNRF